MLLTSSVELGPLVEAAFQYMGPEIILTLVACALLVLDVITPQAKKRWIAYVGLGGVALSGLSLYRLWWSTGSTGQLYAFWDMFVVDGFAIAFKSIFLAAAAISIAISIKYLGVEEEQHGEYYSLILFSTVGMMF